MSSTCFETEGPYSGIRLYVQVWCTCSVFHRHQYKQFSTSTYKTAYTDLCKTPYYISVHTTVFLKINPRVRDMYKITLIKISI